MGLSNPDRASATSIYTHVARLSIPRYPHALHVLSAMRNVFIANLPGARQMVRQEDGGQLYFAMPYLSSPSSCSHDLTGVRQILAHLQDEKKSKS
jgi:hypothetical protein